MAISLSERRRRRLAIVAISSLVGLVAVGANSGAITLLPPGMHHSDLEVAASATHVTVDYPSPSPSIVQRRARPQDLSTLTKHAELLGRLMVSPPGLERIAKRAGVPAGELSGLGRTTAGVPLALTEPGSERRASEIEVSRAKYRLEVQARPDEPIIDIYAQAPSPAGANRLANAALPGLNDYLSTIAGPEGGTVAGDVRLRQLGTARGAVVNSGASKEIALLTFLTAFSLTCAGLLGMLWLRGRERRPREAEAPAREEPPAAAHDDWPHTSRPLPWMLAVFIAVLWLVPFNTTRLTMSAPIDLNLDRLLLPVLIFLWVRALLAKHPGRARLRWTAVHTALAIFLACAFLSVVLDARYLNHTLELDLSVKALPLFVSYVMLFLVVSTAVRRTEVRPFLTYTLALAVICALGMVYEYRFKDNLFYSYTDKLLPGFFAVGGELPGGAVDEIGRRIVQGPSEAPLEAVTMLTLALPIALVRLLQAGRRREQILYALAIATLSAATFATYRKSALLAPLSVVLTLAYFRRRELLKLAPVGFGVLILVSSLSPGAIASTIYEFTRPDRTTLPTVSDRTSDYDAVRPDVWSHFAFGRGLGSYNHVDYRILDSEILHRTIEMGVIGLVAYLLVPLSVLLISRKAIASRDVVATPAALVGAAAGVAFLVVSTLYDVMSFPHGVYIFLYLAGLVAAAVRVRGEEESPAREVLPPHLQAAPRRAPPRVRTPARSPAGVSAAR
jgi:hypothetical protein